MHTATPDCVQERAMKALLEAQSKAHGISPQQVGPQPGVGQSQQVVGMPVLAGKAQLGAWLVEG